MTAFSSLLFGRGCLVPTPVCWGCGPGGQGGGRGEPSIDSEALCVWPRDAWGPAVLDHRHEENESASICLRATSKHKQAIRRGWVSSARPVQCSQPPPCLPIDRSGRVSVAKEQRGVGPQPTPGGKRRRRAAAASMFVQDFEASKQAPPLFSLAPPRRPTFTGGRRLSFRTSLALNTPPHGPVASTQTDTP